MAWIEQTWSLVTGAETPATVAHGFNLLQVASLDLDATSQTQMGFALRFSVLVTLIPWLLVARHNRQPSLLFMIALVIAHSLHQHRRLVGLLVLFWRPRGHLGDVRAVYRRSSKVHFRRRLLFKPCRIDHCENSWHFQQ